MASRYEQLMADAISGRDGALHYVEPFLRRGDVIAACTNLWAATQEGMLAGMTQWRLGAGDPTRYFEMVIEDAARLVEQFDKVPCGTLPFVNMMGLDNGVYAQMLLGREVDTRMWARCHISLEERRRPAYFKEAWFAIEDRLIIELIHGGGLPAEWGAFLAWLDGKKGTRNHSATMRTYAALIEAAREGDRDGVVKAVREAEVNYGKRRNISVTWGGDPIVREQIVDYRLACAIRTAERVGGEVVAGLETVHRWRWG
jgi:hypothetical protein